MTNVPDFTHRSPIMEAIQKIWEMGEPVITYSATCPACGVVFPMRPTGRRPSEFMYVHECPEFRFGR